jgi:hypothetical protein
MWVGLGIGAAVAVICGVGGVVGLGALVVTANDAAKNEARSTATQFMTAWQKQDYKAAYKLTCPDLQNDVGYAQFADRLSQQSVNTYQIGTVELTDTNLTVPVDVTFDPSGPDHLLLDMEVDQSAANRISVCGGF